MSCGSGEAVKIQQTNKYNELKNFKNVTLQDDNLTTITQMLKITLVNFCVLDSKRLLTHAIVDGFAQ